MGKGVGWWREQFKAKITSWLDLFYYNYSAVYTVRKLYNLHVIMHSLRDFLETLPKVSQNRIKRFARFYTLKKLAI